MKWFRTNIKHGSRLALLALAIQFVLTFGHVHASELQPGFAVSISQSAQASIAPSDDAIAVSTPQQPSSPSDSHPPADTCPICALMVLANAVLLATPPVLLPPSAMDLLYRVTDAEFVDLDFARIAFQPRAPPAS